MKRTRETHPIRFAFAEVVLEPKHSRCSNERRAAAVERIWERVCERNGLVLLNEPIPSGLKASRRPSAAGTGGGP
jgi:hypothetical protein